MGAGQDTVEEELPKDEWGHAIAQLDRYGEAISKEFTLVSDRMTWMVVSESFIFAAFATATVSREVAGLLKPLATAMVLLMPVLGMFLALIVVPAIGAAHCAAARLKGERDKLEKRLPERLRVTTVGSKDPENWKGNIPPRCVPWFIFGVWVVLVGVAGYCLAGY